MIKSGIQILSAFSFNSSCNCLHPSRQFRVHETKSLNSFKKTPQSYDTSLWIYVALHKNGQNNFLKMIINIIYILLNNSEWKAWLDFALLHIIKIIHDFSIYYALC